MPTIAIYLQRLDATAAVVTGVRPDQLEDPTSCPDFDVRALINHIVRGVYLFARGPRRELARGDLATLAMPDPESRDFVAESGDVPGAAMALAVDDAVSAWSAPGVSEENLSPGPMVVLIAAAEVAVHGWDLATATGQHYEIPDDAAVSILEGMSTMMGGGERPPQSPFASEVPVEEDASPQSRLIAFTGRRP